VYIIIKSVQFGALVLSIKYQYASRLAT